MQKRIVIAEVKEIKRGTTKGRDWVILNVIDKDGIRYSTFNEMYLDMLGKEADIEYEERQNGKYKNFFILEPGQVAKKKASEVTEGVEKLLKEIQEDVREIKEWTYSQDLPKSDDLV